MEKMERRIITQDEPVDPEDFWGDKQRIVEIIGEGSGGGFKFKNANLPLGWDESLDQISKISLDYFVKSSSSQCELFGYDLKDVTFDTNKILTKLIIAKKDEEISLGLDGNFIEIQKGAYTAKNLRKIGAAVLLQSLISNYLSFGWGNDDFHYGSIGYSGGNMNGYFPDDLVIPKSINIVEPLTGEYYQETFRDNANNIAGRFGVNLEDYRFTENGLLHTVSVTGENGCYYSLEGAVYGKFGRQYGCHNLDSPRQAAALHGIVSSYINFLIGMKANRTKD